MESIKTAFLTILVPLNCGFLEIFEIFKHEISSNNKMQNLQNDQNCSFWAPNWQIWFHAKSKWVAVAVKFSNFHTVATLF